MNAQEKFDELIKGFLKPYFKSKGFKTPGQNFYIDFDEYRLVFQVQKSKWNSKEELEFTFNLGVYDKFIDAKLDNNLIKVPKPYDCILEKRVGSLLPQNLDFWYNVNSAKSLDKLKKEVQEHLDSYVTPYFNKFKSIDDVVKEYGEEKDPFIVGKPLELYFALHLLRNGEKGKAQPILKKYILKWRDNEFWKRKIEKVMHEYEIRSA